MKIYKTKDYDAMSMKAASIIASQVVLKPDSILGLATGSTPVGLYKELIARCDSGELDFSAVKTVNLDEYVGLTGDHDQSYRYFMNTNLFDHINIDKANTNVPDGMAADADAEGKRYDELSFSDRLVLFYDARGVCFIDKFVIDKRHRAK